MDFGMPYTQKQAWNKVKEAVDTYVELTGSDIAVVTKFNEPSQFSGGGDDTVSTKSSLALHGHGHLLLQVKRYLEQIQSQLSVQGRKENGASTEINIPASERNSGINYHNHSVARSLTSSFLSLKLDGNSHGCKSHSENRRKEKIPRRNLITIPKSRDLAELDENFLFEEETPNEDCRNSSDSDTDDEDDDDDFDSDDYSEMCRNSAIIRPCANNTQPPDLSKFGTSLPVNINMNYNMSKPKVKSHYPPMNQQNISATREEKFVADTPQPSKMMASIQALARSVTGDSAQIFGDRPRPTVLNQKFT